MKYDLDESTSTLIKKASCLYIRLSGQYLREYDVPHAYTPFLLQLWEQDGQTQASLYKKIGIEQPTAVRTLDRMERDQFIKRSRNEQDRREVLIFLTKKSINLREKLLKLAVEMNGRVLDGLTASDKKIFNQLLRHTIANLEKELAK